MLSQPPKFLPALLLAAALASAQQPHRIDDAALRNAGKSGEEWLTYGVDQGETRYSPAPSRSTPSNVRRLGPAWSYDLGAGRAAIRKARPSCGMEPSMASRTGAWSSPSTRAQARNAGGVGTRKVNPAGGAGQDLLRRGESRSSNLSRARSSPPSSMEGWRRSTQKPVNPCGRRASPTRRTTRYLDDGPAHCERQSHYRTGWRGASDSWPIRCLRCRNRQVRPWRFYTIPGDPSKKPFESPAMKKAAETSEWRLVEARWRRFRLGWHGVRPRSRPLFTWASGNGGPWPEELRKSKGKRQSLCLFHRRRKTGNG